MQRIEIEKKLFKANEVMAKIAETYEYISPVTLEDQSLFESFFKKEEHHTYGNSWIYVTQGVYGIGPNNLGYKYYDGKNLCMLVSYPKIENQDIIVFYWIRPMGPEILSIIQDYSEKFKKNYHSNSYVKKIFPSQYETLEQHGFYPTEEFPWHSIAHSEDDTFPEVILDRLSTLKKLRVSSKRRSLGRSYREAIKIGLEHDIKITEEDFEPVAWKITKEYFIDYYLNRKKNFSYSGDYYNIIFQSPNKNNRVTRKVILVDNKPMGFYVLEKDPAERTANLYAMIVLRRYYRYLPDYILLKILESQSVERINLGGSEDPGIHRFKLKYCPCKQRKMLWATNYS